MRRAALHGGCLPACPALPCVRACVRALGTLICVWNEYIYELDLKWDVKYLLGKFIELAILLGRAAGRNSSGVL